VSSSCQDRDYIERTYGRYLKSDTNSLCLCALLLLLQCRKCDLFFSHLSAVVKGREGPHQIVDSEVTFTWTISSALQSGNDFLTHKFSGYAVVEVLLLIRIHS
jgi:hypothetical protein